MKNSRLILPVLFICILSVTGLNTPLKAESPAAALNNGFVGDMNFTDYPESADQETASKAADPTDQIKDGKNINEYRGFILTLPDQDVVFDLEISLFIDCSTAVVNGNRTELEAPPVIMNERTMLPARFVAEALGCEVQWLDDTRNVIISSDDRKIVLTVDSTIASVNGEDVELDAPVTIMNGHTMLPIRFIAENVKAVVKWHEETQTVTIEK